MHRNLFYIKRREKNGIYKKHIKKEGWNSLLTSIIFAILGIILINNPESIIAIISYLLGGIFAVIGLSKIISYIKNKGKDDFYNYDMVLGIGSIILGIITIVYRSEIGSVIRILIGIWIVYSAMIRMNVSLKLRNAEDNKIWMCSFIVAIIMLVCGIVAIFTTNIIIVTIGSIILVYSILDIIEAVIFLINLKMLK